MAFLHRLRDRGRGLTVRALGVLLVTLAGAACERGVPPELQPDQVLRAELGLGDDDEVHTIVLTGGDAERADPEETTVPPGAWVQFVSGDFRLHEVHFDVEGMQAGQAAFIAETDQRDSPPMVDRDARFVVSFEGAPPGRYPFVLQGSTAPARGVVVVEAPR